MSSGLVQGVYVNGSLSKSPVNDQAGAKSQLSNLFQALLVILTLLFLAPVFSELPEAVLGAIIIEAVVMGMMDVPEMTRLYRVRRFEFWLAMAALLGVMTFGILQGVFIGVGLSLLWLIAVSSRPKVPELGRKKGTRAFYDLDRHPDGETYPGLAIVRFDGGLFFVNSGVLADQLRGIRIREGSDLNGFILSMEGVDFIDIEGSDTIKSIAAAGKQLNIDVHLCRVKPQVAELLKRDGILDVMPKEHFHSDIDAAVKMHLSKFPPHANTDQ